MSFYYVQAADPLFMDEPRTDWNDKHGFAWRDKETRVSGFPSEIKVRGRWVWKKYMQRNGDKTQWVNRRRVRVFSSTRVPLLTIIPEIMNPYEL